MLILEPSPKACGSRRSRMDPRSGEKEGHAEELHTIPMHSQKSESREDLRTSTLPVPPRERVSSSEQESHAMIDLSDFLPLEQKAAETV